MVSPGIYFHLQPLRKKWLKVIKPFLIGRVVMVPTASKAVFSRLGNKIQEESRIQALLLYIVFEPGPLAFFSIQLPEQ